MAAGAASVEVGRISVKVTPDTSEFRGLLKKQLQALDKMLGGKQNIEFGADTSGVDADVKKAAGRASSTRAKIKVDADTSKAVKSLDRFQRRSLRDLEKYMSQLEARIKLTPDGESWRREIDGAAGRLQSRISGQVPSDVDEAARWRRDIQSEIDAVRKDLEETPLQLRYDSEADYRLRKKTMALADSLRSAEEQADRAHTERLAKFHRELYEKKHKDRLSDWREELRLMKMREEETRKFTDQYRKDNPPIQLQLDDKFDYRLRQRLAKIKPEVEVTPTVRERGMVMLSNQMKNFGSFRGKVMPNFGSGINPAGYAVAVGAILALLAPLVGLITTAMLALPGLIASVIVPIGALALGFEGLKEAATILQEPFQELKDIMSGAVKDQFTPVFETLRAVFPALKEALPSVTKGVADIAQSLANMITDPAKLDQLKSTFSNIGASLTAAAPGISQFSSGLLTLINEFTRTALPDLSGWLGEAGKSFNDWVNRMTAVDVGTGKSPLQGAFEGLGTTLDHIMTLIGDLATKGIEFMNDPEKVESFNNALKTVADTLTNLVQSSSDFIGAMNNISDKGWLATLFGRDGSEEGFWDNFTKGANGIGAGGVQYTFFDEQGNEIPAEQAERLANGIKDAGEAAVANKHNLEQFFQIPAQQAPATNNVLDGLKEQLSTPTTGTPAAAAPVVEPLNTEPAKAELSEYQQFVDTVTQQVRGSLSQAVSGESLPAPNFEAFKTAWTNLVTYVTEQGEAIKTAAAEIPGKIGEALSGLAGIGSTAGAALMQGLKDGMVAGEGALLEYVGTIAGKIAANKGPVEYDRKVLIPNGEALMEGLGTGIESGFSPVLDQVKGFASQLSDSVNDAFRGQNEVGMGVNIAGMNPRELAEHLEVSDKLLSQEQKRLNLEIRRLDIAARRSGSDEEKEALKAKADGLRLQKDEIDLQLEELDLARDLTGDVEDRGSFYEQLGRQIFEGPINALESVASATGGQFLQDLGIGGQGAISQALGQAAQFGKQFVFNVGSMDEALAGKNSIVSKEALQYYRR